MKKFFLSLFLVSPLISQKILKVIPAPGYNNGYYAYGLAWDGSYLWVGDDFDGIIYKIDTTGNVISSFQGIAGANHGLAWDGANLWCAGEYDNNYFVKFSTTGLRIDSIPNNWDYVGGLTFNNGYLWVSVYYPNTFFNIYKVDTSNGNILDTIQSPGTQPQGLAWETQYLWVVMDDNDGDTEVIWKINPLDGSIIDTVDVPTTRPRGLVWDGQYLWLIAQAPPDWGYAGAIYKIDPYGIGNPEIYVPVTSHNFGDVIVGDTSIFYLTYSNVGNDTLIVDSVSHNNSEFFIENSFPKKTPPGVTDTILVMFIPQTAGYKYDTLRIYSNDPLNTMEEVYLQGNGVYQGPEISISPDSLLWGGIRKNALKRMWITIQNVGNSPLLIDSIKFKTNNFFTYDTFPVSISPSTQRKIGIWFNPDTTNVYLDTLVIFNNDIDESMLKVPLKGQGFDTLYNSGEVIWYFDAQGDIWEHIRAIKSIDDINNDGFQDVVAVSENDTLYVFNGNGYQYGDYLWKRYIGTCYVERGLVITPDLNNDGYKDIVLGTVWGIRTIYALSGKDGSILWQFDTHIYGGGGWVYEVSYIDDYDGDGIVEILAATGDDGNNTGPRRVFMFSGADGNIIWEKFLNYAVFGVRAVGDINGDGYPEVAAGTADGGEYAYWLYLLDGTNGNILWSKNLQGAVWTPVPIRDIDNDGITDIAVGISISFSGAVQTYSGVDGSLIWNFSVGGMVTDLNILNDVNGNGFEELLPAGPGISNFYAIDSKTGQSVWLLPSQDAVFSMVSINDLNGDGYDDVIGGTGYNVNRVVVINGVDGSELWSDNFSSPVESVYPIIDIDEDGTDDVLAGLRDGRIYLLANGKPTLISERRRKTKLKNQNPFISAGKLYINLNNIKGNLDILLYDVTGRRVFRVFKGKTEKNILIFDLKKIKHGKYFLFIKNNNIEKIYPILHIN